MSFLREVDAAYVQGLFKRYYVERSGEIYIPSRLQEREFGYFTFREKIMVRHLSFNSPEELRRTLIEKAPLHVYNSSAFYKYPRAPMGEKGWLGSELVFDIDADHLKTPCKKRHDFKICRNCLADYSIEAESCPKCGAPLEKVEWVCGGCLETAREEARKLLDFLEADFGFRDIRMAFSGNRGYHVIVSDREALDLGQMERKELIDYITGTGLEARLLGLGGRKIDPEYAPDLGEPGWRGRIARSALEIVMTFSGEDLYNLTEDERAYGLIDRFEKLRAMWMESPPWGALNQSARRFLLEAARRRAAAHIDVVVTQDTHRLIRLGNSLNGKTGLMAKVFDPNYLDDFDPSIDPVALPMDEEVYVKVIRSQEVRLAGLELQPMGNRMLRLPVAAAALLLCRGVATLPRVQAGRSPG